MIRTTTNTIVLAAIILQLSVCAAPLAGLAAVDVVDGEASDGETVDDEAVDDETVYGEMVDAGTKGESIKNSTIDRPGVAVGWELRTGYGKIWEVVVSDTSGIVAFSTGSGNLTVIDIDSNGTNPPGGVPAAGISMETGNARQWKLSDGRITALAAVPRSSQLAWGDSAGRVGIVDPGTGEMNYTDVYGAAVNSLAVSPDGGTIAAVSDDYMVSIIHASNLTRGNLLAGPGSMVTDIAFSGSGELVAAGGLGGDIFLYDTTSWDVRYTIRTGEAWITALEFVETGDIDAGTNGTGTGMDGLVAAAGSSGRLGLYSYSFPGTDAQPGTVMAVNLTSWANDLLYLSSTGLLAAAQQDGNLTLVPVNNSNTTKQQQICHGALRIPTGAAIFSMALWDPSHAGDLFVTGGADGILRSWARDSDRDGAVDGLDPFPHEGTQWEDRDGDGAGDNPLGRGADAFPSDPAASLDRDGDGRPDRWNPGMTRRDSTTGLELDRFPADPGEWKDSDGDGVGDNRDPAPGVSLISREWHMRFLTFSGFLLLAMAAFYGAVLVHGVHGLRSLGRKLAMENEEPMRTAAAPLAGALKNAASLMARGRCFRAGRVIHEAKTGSMERKELYRQAYRELRNAGRALRMCRELGLDADEADMESARSALAGGRFREAVEDARGTRKKYDERLWDEKRRRERLRWRIPVVADTFPYPAMFATPYIPPSAGIPAPAGIPRPGLQIPEGPQKPANPDPAEAKPGVSNGKNGERTRVINITMKDCIINRSDLKIPDDAVIEDCIINGSDLEIPGGAVVEDRIINGSGDDDPSAPG